MGVHHKSHIFSNLSRISVDELMEQSVACSDVFSLAILVFFYCVAFNHATVCLQMLNQPSFLVILYFKLEVSGPFTTLKA